MKVMKFGGTSVGSVHGILSVKKIVEAQDESVIVVVSALSGITDQLYKVSRLASEGDESYVAEYQLMLQRHLEVIEAVVPEHKIMHVQELIKLQFNDLSNILRGIYLIKDTSPKIIDTIVSYGESASSIIISNAINGAVHFESKILLKPYISLISILLISDYNELIKQNLRISKEFLFVVDLYHPTVQQITLPIWVAVDLTIQPQF